MIHRNELIDPKKLLSAAGAEKPNRLSDGKHVDLVGTGHLLVRPSMLRSMYPSDNFSEYGASHIPQVCGAKLGEALTSGDLSSWGTPYEITRRGVWCEPAYDHERKRWTPGKPAVIAESPDLVDVCFASQYIEMLWPWLNKAAECQLRCEGALGPAVLCDIASSGVGDKRVRLCYPMAILMPCRA